MSELGKAIEISGDYAVLCVQGDLFTDRTPPREIADWAIRVRKEIDKDNWEQDVLALEALDNLPNLIAQRLDVDALQKVLRFLHRQDAKARHNMMWAAGLVRMTPAEFDMSTKQSTLSDEEFSESNSF